MKTGLKVLLLIAIAFPVFVVLSFFYSVSHGYMTLWIQNAGRVCTNGIPNGCIHRTSRVGAVIITRTDSLPRQSYTVSWEGRPTVIHCGTWHALRLPLFGIADVNPPCSLFTDYSSVKPEGLPVRSSLVARRGYAEFVTNDKTKVTASW